MKNFIIYFVANTGSSAIISHLKKFQDHIDIIGFEPFDQHLMNKNKMDGEHLNIIFECLFDVHNQHYNDNKYINDIYNKFTDKNIQKIDPTKSIGFKMRFRDLDFVKNTISNNDVVIFVLIRRDIFRWAISLYDKESTQFKLLKKKIKKNPKIKIIAIPN